MLSNSFLLYALFATLCSTAFSSSALPARDNHGNSTLRSLSDAADQFPELRPLVEGNNKFRQDIATSADPNLLQELTTNGQHPPYMFVGCSDSRVSEGTIFAPAPGTFFTERNIANQYRDGDLNVKAIVAYGVVDLNVSHIIVMGHYGCGGVQASILDRPSHLDSAGEAVQDWIDPVRALYHNSTRDEIVKLREYRAANPNAGAPGFDDAGFRALVEENTKRSVFAIAGSTIVHDHWEAFLAQQNGGGLKPVYVHGFVYDISTGNIYDLNVSQGPPGYKGSSSKCKRNILDALVKGHTPNNVDGC